MAIKKRIVKVAKKKVAEDMDMARKIWLAGVGAYARATAQAQDQLTKLAAQADQAFDELVEQGETMEDEVREKLAAYPAAGKVANLVDAVAKQAEAYRAAQSARVAGVRKQVEERLAPLNPMLNAQSVQKISAKLDALSVEVARMKGEKTTRASASKTKAPAKTAAKTARVVRKKVAKKRG
jgi:hypothetical protein